MILAPLSRWHYCVHSGGKFSSSWANATASWRPRRSRDHFRQPRAPCCWCCCYDCGCCLADFRPRRRPKRIRCRSSWPRWPLRVSRSPSRRVGGSNPKTMFWKDAKVWIVWRAYDPVAQVRIPNGDNSYSCFRNELILVMELSKIRNYENKCKWIRFWTKCNKSRDCPFKPKLRLWNLLKST